jgi:hypothetical protein
MTRGTGALACAVCIDHSRGRLCHTKQASAYELPRRMPPPLGLPAVELLDRVAGETLLEFASFDSGCFGFFGPLAISLALLAQCLSRSFCALVFAMQ